MANCSGCRKSIKASEKATCSQNTCAKQYHLACVNLTADIYKKNPVWVCPLCVSKQPKTDDNSDTPVKLSLTIPINEAGRSNVTTRRGTPTPTSSQEGEDMPSASSSKVTGTENLVVDDVILAVKKAMTAQFRELGDRITELDSSVKYLSGQCDDILKSYGEMKNTIASLGNENKQLKEELVAVKARTRALEDAQARQEQWSRAQNIEIVGVPENSAESTVDLVLKTIAQTGVHLQNSDIEFAHRVQPRRPTGAPAGAGRAIIARFRQRTTKDAVIAASRRHRHISSKNIGMGGEAKKIFVNEHLTKENKHLLKSCKIKAQELNYKHVWTKNCRIFMRKTDTSAPIPIICLSDLDKIKH